LEENLLPLRSKYWDRLLNLYSLDGVNKIKNLIF
jgi:hypothetical protein